MTGIEDYQKQVAYLKQAAFYLENILRYIHAEYYINARDTATIEEAISRSGDQRVRVTTIEQEIF